MMNCSATPPPSQCPTEAFDASHQNIHIPLDNTADATPAKAIKDWTWSEHLNMLSPIHSSVSIF